jgi:hypothetical protein
MGYDNEFDYNIKVEKNMIGIYSVVFENKIKIIPNCNIIVNRGKFLSLKEISKLFKGTSSHIWKVVGGELKVEETELLKFEEVLKAFKQGKPISRQSKSEEYLFIYKQIPAKIDVSIVPAMTSVPDEVKEVMKKLEKGFHYKNQAVQVDKNGNVTYWITTVEDLLAEDWYILED